MTHSGKISIVFFGSGPVAAASLDRLCDTFDVEAVVTKPKPTHHKGDFPVIAVAEKHELPTILVASKKEVSEKLTAANFKSEVAVLIDFGIIVSQDVIDMFPSGIINSHFSLLPEWRGADPITFAILSGQQTTGVSLMRLVEAMDEGPLLAIGAQALDNSSTTPWLTDRLISLSDALLKRELPRYLNGGATLIKQEDLASLITDFPYPNKPTYSRKLAKMDGLLDFNKPAIQLDREVRAYLEWPKSRMTLGGKDVTITRTRVVNQHGTPGEYIVTGKELLIYTGEQALAVESLKPSGKKEMPIQAFLAGYSNTL